jgi:hypothetical protein
MPQPSGKQLDYPADGESTRKIWSRSMPGRMLFTAPRKTGKHGCGAVNSSTGEHKTCAIYALACREEHERFCCTTDTRLCQYWRPAAFLPALAGASASPPQLAHASARQSFA